MKPADVKKLTASRLRHKITIQSGTLVQDSYSASTEWTIFATVWASKDPLLGNEFFQAEAMQSKVEVKFRTRYISGVTNAMRVYHGSEAYQILSAINVESRNRELLIYAKKVT